MDSTMQPTPAPRSENVPPPAPQAAPPVQLSPPLVVETPPNTKQETPKKPGLEESLKRIGTLRDGILTSAGVVYICGYGVWAYNAWRNNLGLLPALQYQYFVAGLSLLLIIALSLLVFYVGMSIELTGAKFRFWLSKNLSKKIRNKELHWFLSHIMIMFLFFLMIVLGSRLITHFVPAPFGNKFFKVVWGYFCLCFLWGQWLPRQQETAENILPSKPSLKTTNVFLMGMRLFGTQAWTVLIFVITYLVSGYASIPQEFGGAKPRLAYLDVKRADISAETRADLLPANLQTLPADTSKDPAAVARTIVVDVYYNSSDFYLVRPHGAKVETPVTQVKKETVQGVRWLGHSEPPPIEKNVSAAKPTKK